MPQMSPMSWMLIYIYFIMMFILFIMKVYFTKNMMLKIMMKYMKTFKMIENDN